DAAPARVRPVRFPDTRGGRTARRRAGARDPGERARRGRAGTASGMEPAAAQLFAHLRGRLRGRLLQLQVGRGPRGGRLRRLRGGRALRPRNGRALSPGDPRDRRQPRHHGRLHRFPGPPADAGCTVAADGHRQGCMRVATWNVNSLKIRLPQVLEWTASAAPDVLAMQEIKQLTEAVPLETFREQGYHAIASGQKTYNGVATIA